jgi:pSer/pThr/pTyr-binding forkhead associated (FHA) protein
VLPGTTYDLSPQTTIGRGPTNTIQLSDNFISSEHTRIWLRNNTWYVQDAGSINGTYLNNQPAREALPAKIGDIVQVGYIRFKLAK